MQSILPDFGGADTLSGGDDFDILVGGFGFDTFVGSLTTDVIIGNYARVRDIQGSDAPLVASDPVGRDLISASMFDIYNVPSELLAFNISALNSLYTEADLPDEPPVQNDTQLRLIPAISSFELLRMSESDLRQFLRNLPLNPADSENGPKSNKGPTVFDTPGDGPEPGTDPEPAAPNEELTFARNPHLDAMAPGPAP